MIDINCHCAASDGLRPIYYRNLRDREKEREKNLSSPLFLHFSDFHTLHSHYKIVDSKHTSAFGTECVVRHIRVFRVSICIECVFPPHRIAP
jgi:hypothetical protein